MDFLGGDILANENMKNSFRLLLNILHRLLDDKADTEYVDQKINEVGKDVSLGVSEAVVGQTAKITEVDEAGRPVKWEAVKMANDGASSWNDLTDKPFGKEGEANYLVSPVDVPFVYGDAYPDEPIAVDPADFAVGTILYVVWDGTVYETTVQYHNMAMYNHIGGTANDGTSIPFTINDIDGTGALTISDYTNNPTGTIHFALAKSLETMKTLDPAYLPFDNEVSETGEGVLRNKTVAKALNKVSEDVGASSVMYTLQNKTEDEQMQARENLDLYRKERVYPIALQIVYVGWWEIMEDNSFPTDVLISLPDGTEYEIKRQSNRTGDKWGGYEKVEWYGNGNLLAESGAFAELAYDWSITEEKYADLPFVVWKVSSDLVTVMKEKWFGLSSDISVTISDSIMAYNTATVQYEYIPVPEEYIPETIARKTDIPEAGVTSWNDLTDKPFGKETGVVYAAKETVIDYQGSYVSIPSDLPADTMQKLFTIGSTITVIVDGVEYSCIVKDGEEGIMFGMNWVGNAQLRHEYNDNTGESFFVCPGESYTSLLIAFTDTGNHTISVCGVSEILKQIPSEYVPFSAGAVTWGIQELTDEQKQKVRSNIGASRTGFARSGGSWDALTTEEQNIEVSTDIWPTMFLFTIRFLTNKKEFCRTIVLAYNTDYEQQFPLKVYHDSEYVEYQLFVKCDYADDGLFYVTVRLDKTDETIDVIVDTVRGIAVEYLQ